MNRHSFACAYISYEWEDRQLDIAEDSLAVLNEHLALAEEGAAPPARLLSTHATRRRSGATSGQCSMPANSAERSSVGTCRCEARET